MAKKGKEAILIMEKKIGKGGGCSSIHHYREANGNNENHSYKDIGGDHETQNRKPRCFYCKKTRSY